MCLALMGPGDTAIVPAPYFPVHMYAVALASGNVIALDVSDSEKFLSNVAYTCEQLYPKPKLLILCYPHNPSTATIDPEFYVDVVKIAKKYGLMVISDFAYADIAFDGYKPPSILEADGAKDVAVEFYSLTKTFSMPGWRVAFCVGNPEVIAALAKLKSYLDYGTFQPIQIAATVVMNEERDFPNQVLNVYQSRRDTLVRGLNRLGWKVDAPKGTMFLWAPIPDPYIAMGSVDFCKHVLNSSNVALSPGVGFGPGGEGYVRFALVENEQRIRQAMTQIAGGLELLKK